MTAMMEDEEGYEIQLVLAYFGWIGHSEAEKLEGNIKESYSSQDKNEREKWQ